MINNNNLRRFVVENFLFGDEGQLQDDTSFTKSGIIDSTGVLELVFFIEEAYNIKIKDEEIIPENLDNLKNITEFLKWKLGSI